MFAVIICGNETFEKRGKPHPVPHLHLGGTTLLGRAIRSLQRSGVDNILIASPEYPAHEQRLADDPWVTANLSWHRHARPAHESALILQELDALPDEAFWVVTADRTLHPRMLKKPEQDVIPTVTVSASETHNVLGPVYGGREMVQALASTDVANLDEACEVLLERNQMRALEAEDKDVTPIREHADLKRAKRRLFDALRKPFGRGADGVAAYYVNRPISRRISPLLVNTPITPNHITFLGLLMGIFAGFLVSGGDWLSLAVGGLLLQFSSVIDGVDGELARVRLTMSKFGEWFDTVADDIINITFMIGLGFGCLVRTESSIFPFMAVTTAALMVVAVFILYRELIKSGVASHNDMKWGFESDEPPGLLRRAGIIFAYLAKRDLYTLIVSLLLVVNLPVGAFVLMVGGAQVLFVMLVTQKILLVLRNHQPETQSVR